MKQPAILSDIGNVLVSFDFSDAAARFAERSRYSREEVLHRLDPLKVPLESGRLRGAAFIQQGMELIDFQGSPEEFQAIWCDIFGPNDRMLETLAAIPGEVPKYLLSNTSDLHKEYLLASFPVFRHFKDGVYSYLEESMKPEEKIFRAAIEQFALDPAQTFFIDDLAPNIETARRLGFRVFHYHFDRHASLEQELREWLERCCEE